LFYEKRVEDGWEEMECMSSLPNGEDSWERPKQTQALDQTEVERRIGSASEPLEILSGGLANLNVRIGVGQVLRIYRRDPGVAGKECALLRSGWKSFRVPGVLMSGEDFLLMEYIAHKPIDGDAVHGAAAGQALAEIHRVSYSQAGELNAELAVCRPFGDVIDAFREYAFSELEKLEPALGQGIRTSVVAFLEKYQSELRALSGSPVLLHGDFKASNLHWTDRGEFLVFDWEFAYAGPKLMDVGQLIRWRPPASFIEGFASAYRDCGGTLPTDWQKWAGAFDLFNLIGLLSGVPPDSRRAIDVRHRIQQILDEFD
jgi:fructosamine-3-kinase